MSEDRIQGIKQQFETNSMTMGDIVAAYRIFLGRLPREGDPFVDFFGRESSEVLAHFMELPEFRQDPGRINSIARAAKVAMERHQQRVAVK